MSRRLWRQLRFCLAQEDKRKFLLCRPAAIINNNSSGNSWLVREEFRDLFGIYNDDNNNNCEVSNLPFKTKTETFHDNSEHIGALSYLTLFREYLSLGLNYEEQCQVSV